MRKFLSALLSPIFIVGLVISALLLVNSFLDSLLLDLVDLGYQEYFKILQKLMLTFQWLIISWLIGRLLHVLVVNPLFFLRVGRESPAIIGNLLSLVLVIFSMLIAISSIWGFELGGLMATSGIITLVAGLAMREIIMDFFSGIALNIEHPYRLGDWLKVGDSENIGEVVAINWRATHLCLNDMRVVVIPNSLLARNSFINYNLPNAQYRENMGLVFRYNIDPKRIENILMSAILAMPGLVDEAKHRVRIDSFDPRGVLIEIKFWIPNYAMLIPIKHALASNVLLFLDKAGIPLPYFTHEVFNSNLTSTGIEKRIDSESILKKVSLFNSLSPTEINRIASGVYGMEYPAGAEIIREGEDGESLYVVREGLLQVNIDGQRVGQVYPGQIFGEQSLLTGAPRSATVRMVTAGYLIEVSKKDIGPLIRERSEIAEILANNMLRWQAENDSYKDVIELQNALSKADRAKEIGSRIHAFFRQT
jgi:small-conductance mechanosensitive channel